MTAIVQTETSHWPMKPLADLCDLLPARSISTSGDVEVLALTTACLDETGFRPSGVKPARMWARDVPDAVATHDEILIARSNTPDLVGRAAVFTGNPKAAVATDLTIRVKPRDMMSSQYLSAYLTFLYLGGYWKQRAGGASGSMKKVTRKQILELVVPVPPMCEQEQIAADVNEQMQEVEHVRLAAEEKRAILERFVESVLSRSIAEGSTTRFRLGECLVETSQGVGDRWNQYRVLGATRAGLALARENVGKNPNRYKLVDRATIFYNPMRILLGSIGMVDDGDLPGITSPDYVVFTARPGTLHPRWFYYWMRSRHGELFIRGLARGAVRERMRYRQLADATIALPSWDRQLKAAEVLRAVARTRRLIGDELDLAKELPASLLSRTFRRIDSHG